MRKAAKKLILSMRGIHCQNGTILGYKKYLAKNKKTKTALFSYLTKPFLSFSNQIPHSNWAIARNIAKALNQSGFIVDITDWEDKKFLPEKKYDLFIGIGGKNFEKISQALNADCVKIYFATGLYWKFHNDQEAKRIKEVCEKKGKKLKTSRALNESEEGALKSADAIIALGDKFSRKTYSGFSPVYTLDNFYQPDKKFNLNKKNFTAAKNNYLFLSGSGNIHKGLHLALESFLQMPDKNLYICTKLEEDFAQAYKKELFETKNIHYLGFLKEGSEELRKIMSKCGYYIHLSCSEGSPGAVILAMSYGLVPIISSESNINIGTIGYELSQNTAEEIKKTIIAAGEKGCDLARAEQIVRYAEEKFSEECFSNKFKDCLNSILTK